MTKVKMLHENQPCRNCGTPIVKRIPKSKKNRSLKPYIFKYYLHCPSCNENYMVESAKVYTQNSGSLFD